ncbi:unnamed protein product [Rotaria sp. Silwood2]|nr:unnamed protein product [Rotaria sp. Silwood2]CAF3180170.1 unnamed protein product [Rotaria sp. Silwood2]CAF4319612.1 unnamed protein product [Rotaria sp. Silwood2]CAF4555751.1 unnamed protein product [Rotaria sp. Silwood2]CAF4558438.1 unnamed protein product [Rotaria sp. Silwood2]
MKHIYQNQQQQYHRVEMINTLKLNSSSSKIPFKNEYTQQAPTKEDIVRTTKYVLTDENLDVDGEIVTDFVKSDVLPSDISDVNVIFNDIE